MKSQTFKISLDNESGGVSQLNEFLASVELKQVFASIVNEENEPFWSILAFYEDEKTANSKETNSEISAQVFGSNFLTPIAEREKSKKPASQEENDFNKLKKLRSERAAPSRARP